MSHKVPPHLIPVMLQGDYSIWTINRHISQTVSHGETIQQTQTSQPNTIPKFQAEHSFSSFHFLTFTQASDIEREFLKALPKFPLISNGTGYLTREMTMVSNIGKAAKWLKQPAINGCTSFQSILVLPLKTVPALPVSLLTSTSEGAYLMGWWCHDNRSCR